MTRLKSWGRGSVQTIAFDPMVGGTSQDLSLITGYRMSAVAPPEKTGRGRTGRHKKCEVKADKVSMTFSVAAFDRRTGELGVAVHGCYPAIGTLVPHVRPGVGAVAIQGTSDARIATDILDHMAAGLEPLAALHETLRTDPAADARQLAVVAVDGRAAGHTGSAAIDHAAHIVGDGVVVAANTATSPLMAQTMAATYKATASSPLTDRLLLTLQAGQRADGDVRGPLSAALLVTGGVPDRLDVRIDASADPVADLIVAAGDMRAYALTDPTPETISRLAQTPQPLFWHLLAEAEKPGCDYERLVMLLRGVLQTQPGLGTALDRMKTPTAILLRARLGRLASATAVPLAAAH